ncbi:MAG: hypothetical protein ACRDBQ_23770 [Shewanella sp.]
MSVVRIDGVDYHTEEDGVTHINVYSGGKTNLGRFWSNFHHSNTMTPHGLFSSLEGYYHYLKVLRSVIEAKKSVEQLGIHYQLEKLKSVYGKAAQQAGRELRKHLASLGIYTLDVPDEWFNANFKEALVNKLNDDKQMQVEVFDNQLPYLHYYVMGKNVFYKEHFSWLTEQINSVIEDTEYLIHAGTRKSRAD